MMISSYYFILLIEIRKRMRSKLIVHVTTFVKIVKSIRNFRCPLFQLVDT